jgi:hypothetical protein
MAVGYGIAGETPRGAHGLGEITNRTNALAARGKKGLQQRSRILGEKSWGDVDTVVEFARCQDFKAGAESSAFRIVGGIDKPRNACLNDGAGTHCARFERDVEGRVGKAIVAEQAGALADHDDLGVGRRIVIADGAVATARDEHFIVHQERANGSFASFRGSVRLVQRDAHKV